jgi:DNA-binding CsgD family transcriptional regulator
MPSNSPQFRCFYAFGGQDSSTHSMSRARVGDPKRVYSHHIPSTTERRVLALVGDVMGLLDLDELCRALIVSLREAVPADWCALHELPAELPHTLSLTEPPLPLEFHEVFARYASQNPLVGHYLRTHDGRATRFSDLVTRRQLHRLDLYREVYRPLGVEYQISFTLPSASARLLGVALSRGKRDFSTAERELLNLARPYLIQVYRNALSHTQLRALAERQILISDLVALKLTTRQAETLRLVAMGHSDRGAAAALGIEVSTVHKHLQNSYRTLGVRSRSQAAGAAWATTRSKPT